MADILPECLIQKILCYLSFKEATKMRILSKTWLQAWSTLPTLKFTSHYLERNTKKVDNIMQRYRDEKIPIENFELLLSGYFPQGFTLIDKWLDIALQNGVKDLVLRVPRLTSYTFLIFKILAAKSLRELVLSDCNLKHVSLASGVTICHSLRKLSLSFVQLDVNMLQTLLNSCPLIVSFILKYCDGLEKIELLNLQNIKSVCIRTQRYKNHLVKILAPNLEHLSYSYSGAYSYSGDFRDSSHSLEKLDVVECQNLKSLDISNVMISDGFLRHLISRSQSLKVLNIRDCKGIGQIDAPNLVSLEYMGEQIPELKISRESSQLKHSKIILHCYYLDAGWFCKLRTFLSNSTSLSHVSLDFPRYNVINMKYLQMHHRVATPQVDILNVNTLWQMECPAFVDALLWSCHPRRLNLYSSIEMIKSFISRLMYMKNLSHSTSHRSTPRHSQLKDVKAFDRKNQPLELRSGELAIRNLRDWEEVHFLLDWWFN